MENILFATLTVGVLGLVFGALLGIASRIFKVEKDEKYSRVMEVLPGANCGGCGFAGCSQFAEALVAGTATFSGCGAGGEKVSEEISKIMGLDNSSFQKKVAYVNCAGCDGVAKDKYVYNGLSDCLAASKLLNGHKQCSYGCLGLGSCASACRFGAIKIENGIAMVDTSLCTGCGVCVKACPKGLISLINENEKYRVKCMNKDKGAVAKNACDVSCIGCKICEKNCPDEAISVNSFLAEINPEKCTGCGTCAEKCPRNTIEKITV